MTKLVNVSDSLKKLAKYSYKKHAFIREWQVFIAITIVLKLAAMVFSIFAGYFYFNNLFVSILNAPFWAKVFAVIALIIIEVLTAISLSKFFKFALRLELKTAIPILILSVFFFGVSFVSSTNGLALRQSTKVDNTEVLTAQYNDKILNSNILYKANKAQIIDQINTVKANPQGWSKGKRTILLADQLKQIDKYYSTLQVIEKEHKATLAKLKDAYDTSLQINNNQISTESDKYYKIVSFIMAIIFLINGLLMFFHSKVFNENEKELSTIEVVNTFGQDIENKAVNLIENRIADTFSMYFNAIQNSFDNKQIQLNSSNTDKTPAKPKPITIGFGNRNTTKFVNTQNVEEPKVNTENRVCVHCGKEFVYKTWNQKFCQETCRIEHWEQKTNRKLIKNKKK